VRSGDAKAIWVITPDCQSYALEAKRKMGEMLKKTERAKGGNPKLTGNIVFPVEPTLASLGLTTRESAKAQMLTAGAKGAD
jgi:hypothetical protein